MSAVRAFLLGAWQHRTRYYDTPSFAVDREQMAYDAGRRFAQCLTNNKDH